MSNRALKERKKIMKLVKSIKNRDCVEDPKNEFYGQIDFHLHKTSDFYHKDYHDDERKSNAKFELSQVRIKSIGSSNYLKKYQSIKSVGIQEEVVSIQNNDPHSLFEATTLDGNGRVIITEDVESKNEGEELDVPHFIITDGELIKLIERKKKFFQNKMNDQLPHSSSDPEEIKEYIREQIQNEPNPHFKPFKSALIDEVYDMVCNARTRGTVSNWVTEIFNEMKQNQAGIVCWKVADKRWAKVRKELENSNVRHIVDNWTNDSGLEHDKYIIHSKATSGGNIEKDLGTIIVHKEHDNEIKSVICVFFTVARSTKAYYDSLLDAFNKLEAVEQKYNFYDYVFALGQLKGVDAGNLLTKADVLKAKKEYERSVEEENNKVIRISAVK